MLRGHDSNVIILPNSLKVKRSDVFNVPPSLTVEIAAGHVQNRFYTHNMYYATRLHPKSEKTRTKIHFVKKYLL